MSLPLRRLLVPIGAVIALVTLLGAGLRRDPSELPSPLVGKPAPAFSLPRLDQPTQNFGPEQLRGQVWLLNVWASWCTSCRKEHPLLVELAKKKAVTVVGLDYMDTRAEAGKWLAEHGDPYKLSVEDAKGRAGMDWGVVGVPETFVIDKAGVVRFKFTGPITQEAWDKTLAPLLRELERG
ncbi:DsbE family thiol:disulfide interchange protein [Derxia gummosa]|uniref:DsbE family thiol:disulfide interchange protein n=1 Tax=Derxia gummosa DSM 723 TaxID=1121388 RepID=A0A9U5CT79_9BURK|nr:DsbE family thiol:disulfide interchange protein [Derxia gummosa]